MWLCLPACLSKSVRSALWWYASVRTRVSCACVSCVSCMSSRGMRSELRSCSVATTSHRRAAMDDALHTVYRWFLSAVWFVLVLVLVFLRVADLFLVLLLSLLLVAVAVAVVVFELAVVFCFSRCP